MASKKELEKRIAEWQEAHRKVNLDFMAKLSEWNQAKKELREAKFLLDSIIEVQRLAVLKIAYLEAQIANAAQVSEIK